jgi:hypothetical protein
MLQSEIFLHQAGTSWNTTLRENDFIITLSISKRKNPEQKLFVTQSNFCRRAVSLSQRSQKKSSRVNLVIIVQLIESHFVRLE